MSEPMLHRLVDGPADADVLVLSNSLGSTTAMWDPQLSALREQFRVVRYDHRGHGRSAVPAGPYDLADLAGDVVRLLDDLGVERAHFCGLSLGGMVGMWLAIHEPDRIDRLVLCCTSSKLGPPGAWTQRAATVRSQGTAAIADAVVGRWVTPGFAQAHPDRVRQLRSMVLTTPAEGYAACCEAIERMDVHAELPKVTAPTLVIAGVDDPATPLDHGRRIADTIPDARLEIVAPGAHLANVEAVEQVTALVLDHLDSVTSRGTV